MNVLVYPDNFSLIVQKYSKKVYLSIIKKKERRKECIVIKKIILEYTSEPTNDVVKDQ